MLDDLKQVIANCNPDMPPDFSELGLIEISFVTRAFLKPSIRWKMQVLLMIWKHNIWYSEYIEKTLKPTGCWNCRET
jgi:hypothetical protein